MIEKGEINPEDITGYEEFRAKSILRLKDILTNPDFYYPETNDDFTKITYGRKYDGVKKQDGFLAVTIDTGNLNAGLITIHPKKFNDKILKNKNLVWNTLLNSTNSEPLIGETVEKQSNEPNSILAQRNDLSTNNYDGIPNPQINYSLSDQNNTSDNDYLAAVENDDMKTAQKMVDEAAENAFKDSKIRDKNNKFHTPLKSDHCKTYRILDIFIG